MTSETNWLKVALAAEQPNQGATPGGSQTPNTGGGLPGSFEEASTKSTDGTPEISPKPTPTATEKVQQDKAQKAEVGNMRNIAVPDAANKALPALNQSLHYLTQELVSRDDMRLPETAARGLAIEIMAAWLAASRKGPVSELASIIAKSPRVNAVLDTVP